MLGTVELTTSDGTPVLSAHAQPKRLALLAYLALARPHGPQRRDTLLGLFWPELDETHARGALRQAVHHLRQVLGEQALVARGHDDLALEASDLACDALAFEAELDAGRPEAAIAIYRGDLLQGFFLHAAPGFEHWLERECARLRGRAAAGAWAVAEQRAHAADVGQAEEWGLRALALSNDDEVVLQRLLRLLDQLGDRVTAVREYDAFARRVRRDYEMEPSAETRRLIDAIRARTSGGTPPALNPPPSVPAPPAVRPATPSPATEPAPRAARRARRPFALVALTLLIVLGAVAWRGWAASRRAATPAIHHIAVLPIADLTGRPDQAYFVSGMHEALITELAGIAALDVRARQSMLRYAGTRKSVEEIARELDVEAVVSGAVFRSGDSVRLTVQLVRAVPSERQLWVGTYWRRLQDVARLHGDVAREIADRVHVEVTADEARRLGRPRVVAAAAYDAWMKGTYHRRTGRPCVPDAKEAIAIDPAYAPSYALLSICYVAEVYFAAAPPRETFALAKAAASRALALDETLGLAHAQLAWILATYDWNWAAAEASYRRAIDLDPNAVEVLQGYSFFLSAIGRSEEAIRLAKRAEELDPLSLSASQHVSFQLYLARRFDEAVAQARRTISMDSTYMFAHDRLHSALSGKRAFTEAVPHAETAARLAGPDDLRRRAFLALAYGEAGRTAEAQAIVDELLALSRHRYVPPWGLAAAYVGLGDRERAIQSLQSGFDGRDGDMWLLKAMPLWDPLRADPRFQQLVMRMRFPE